MKSSSIPYSLSLSLYISHLKMTAAISENNPVTYEGLPLGCWQKEDYKKQWCDYPSSSSGASSACRQEIITDPYNPENTCMRLTLPANTTGGSSGGMTADIDIKQNYPAGSDCLDQPFVEWETAFFQYQLMFEENFDWSKGGKLPGLTTYPDTPTGCIDNSDFDGNSVRYMWRENGQLFLYLYYPEKKERCGDYYTMSPPFYFAPGTWYTLTQEVYLNNIGLSDGYIKVWIDGVLSLSLSNLVLRRSGDLYEDDIKMDCFRGGSDSSWASLKDSYVYFDEFKLYGVSACEHTSSFWQNSSKTFDANEKTHKNHERKNLRF